MKTTLGEKVFWAVIALSSIGAALYGYDRFKLIRPDLFGNAGGTGISETERRQRISEYQQKGDALTRAARPPSNVRAPGPGETCANGVIVRIARDGAKTDATAVLENGKPVRCETGTAPTIH